ncbi:hypothetical protein J2X45_003941 [Caulobacter sp. BE264]|uniref:hypothetical protein n=1 Tax=Caulobacter sp. BE264 TaxID=2817724 RepID=UPI002859A2DE|nr:hypothetical protein [Caulobacter sp. BE264]MDR7232831.1 hypothetical protein [Caulobacter sp. BE264]
MTDDEAKAEGLTVRCPNGHEEWMHPEMVIPEGEPFFCGECGHVFGTWREVHGRLFTASAMLDATLKGRA